MAPGRQGLCGARRRRGSFPLPRLACHSAFPMKEPNIHQYISSRLTLSYCHWPNPGAPNLLLVHGGKDHNRNWELAADALAGEFKTVAPHSRAHGDSAWSPAGCYYHSAWGADLAP